jgi:hypothetical protein
MMGSAVEQLGRREREAKGTSMPLRTPSMSERNGFRKRNMSASDQTEKNSVRAYVFRFVL